MWYAFFNLAYVFDFGFTGIRPLPHPLLHHTGVTGGLCPGLSRGPDPEAVQGRIPRSLYFYLKWFLGFDSVIVWLLLLCYYIWLYVMYALMFNLFCSGDSGAYREMLKIRETICMWRDCLLGSPRENWRSILLLKEKYVLCSLLFI